MTQRRAPSLADTLPNQVEVDRLVPDNQDTVILTRPFPDADEAAMEARRGRTESLPTIGQIARYALKYTLGEGGLGTVYAAHDPLLSRAVAIKTLHVDPSMTDPERFNALFLNEARAAGGLSHPQIVTVYDAGTSEQGPYIAMELLKGKDLRQLLAQGWRPTPSQAALIVRRVADALSYAHHKGVIHRDIKPANILLMAPDSSEIRISDFGAALHTARETTQIAGVGSPAYMSPQQVREVPLDHRTDIYSLGVVMFQLLTGRLPFEQDNSYSLLYSIAHDTPPPPSELRPEVPEALDAIVRRATEKDVDRRYQSWSEFSHDLALAYRNLGALLATAYAIQRALLGLRLAEGSEELRAHIEAVYKGAPTDRDRLVDVLGGSRGRDDERRDDIRPRYDDARDEDGGDDGQTQAMVPACIRPGRVDPIEAVEQSRQMLGRDGTTNVADAQRGSAIRFIINVDPDGRSPDRKTGRVADQVRQRAPDQPRIDGKRGIAPNLGLQTRFMKRSLVIVDHFTGKLRKTLGQPTPRDCAPFRVRQEQHVRHDHGNPAEFL